MSRRHQVVSETDIEKFMEAINDEMELQLVDTDILNREVASLIEEKGKYHVPQIGDISEKKPDGVFRFMACQFNNMSTNKTRERKVRIVKHLVNKYEINTVLGSEMGTNFSRMDPSNSFGSWFEGTQSIRSTTSHNVYSPSRSRYLAGGTGIVVFNELLQYAHKPCNDFRRLGRYCSWVFQANPTHRFRIVVVYSTGIQRPKGVNTIYQQQLAYMRNHNLHGTPAKLLENDLRQVLKQWIKDGDRIVLCGDLNDHILSGNLSKMLTKDVGLIEKSHDWWQGGEPHTYIDGSKPIDGLFTSYDVEISSFLMLSFHESPGDHRAFIFDVTSQSMLGQSSFKIQRHTARRLSLKNPRSVKSHLSEMKRQFAIHRIEQRRLELRILSRECGTPLTPELTRKWRNLHKQVDEITIHSESRCRILQYPELPWSEPVGYWYKRKRAYEHLASILERGGSGNISNAIRSAHRNGIVGAESLTLFQVRDGIQYCKKRINSMSIHASALRKVTQRNQLIAAEAQGNTQKVIRLKQIAANETSKKKWRRITRSTKSAFGGAVLKTTQIVDGVLVTNETESSVLESLQATVSQRFLSAHSAPIHDTPISELLCYPTDSSIPDLLLDKTYALPESLDESTRWIINEIRLLTERLPSSDTTQFVYSVEDFRHHWSSKRERTSSSPSGIHIGIYKAALQDEELVAFYANYWTDILQFKVPPDRWYDGLQVALQKEIGNLDVERLRFIQLYEADLNNLDKFIFGHLVMQILLKAGEIPEEHFAQKESTAEDANMDKTLTFDLSRLSKTPMANVSVDAENCFDRISHVILMLIWYAITQDWMLVTMFLKVIGHMRLFQRTGYGDSNTFVGGHALPRPFQGKGQGSGGAPAAWIHHSTLAILAYLRQGFSSSFRDPVTRDVFGSMGRLFVDDTNLYVTMDTDYMDFTQIHEELLNTNYMDPIQLYEELLVETQLATSSWGSLLIAGGGSAKQKKCYWQPILYECTDGEWTYVNAVDVTLKVPQPGDTDVAINQLSPFESAKELGVRETVAGGSQDQLLALQEKFRRWVAKIRNSHLQPSDVWMALRLQMWPGIRYSLGTLTNDMEEISDLFQDLYYTLLPSLGVVRSFRKQLRTVHQSFGGVGLWHMPTEQLIERLTLLLQHYQKDSTLGRKFRAMTRWLQIEVGTNLSPFTLSYDTWAPLATHCWHKMLWRTVEWSGVEVYIDSIHLPLPRENDICIMEYVLQQGVKGDELSSINRCRLALHLMFLSDIMAADGLHLERSLVLSQGCVPLESTYVFPPSLPSRRDWQRWESFWSRVSGPSYSTYRFLGRWINDSHHVWRWYYDEDRDAIYYKNAESSFVTFKARGSGRTRSQRTYFSSSSEPSHLSYPGVPASVRVLDYGDVQLLFTGPALYQDTSAPHPDFWSFLADWGGTWMWRKVINSADSPTDLHWLTAAMKSGTALWCTDGSHDSNLAPEISGAGWLIYDTVTTNQLSCELFERSDKASSFRGEMIGSLALHILCTALEQFFDLPPCSNKFYCDNEVTLNEATRVRSRIPTKAACSDALRHMRGLKGKLRMKFEYTHVAAHADDDLQWHQLTAPQQLNCRCDLLAKRAVATAIELGSSIPKRFLFPQDAVAVFVNGWKQTTDISSSVRFEVGKQEARKVLTQPYVVGGQLKPAPMSGEQFDEVDWKSRDQALVHGDMFNMWLTKQTSNMCATGVQTSRYSGQSSNFLPSELVQDRCPNCGMRGERASHLCQCPDPDRTRLFQDQVDDLAIWMTKSYGHPELAHFLPRYLLLRGTREFTTLGTMSPEMMLIARSQEIIGWRNLTEGKLSRLILPMQQSHLRTTPSRITGAAWVKQLIHRILQITHSQWIYRNVTLHHKSEGVLAKQRSHDLLHEIELILLTPEDELPNESKYLLDINLDTLRKATVDEQENFVYVAKAAIRAGQRCHGGRAKRKRALKRRSSVRQKLGLDDVETQLQQTRSPFSQMERDTRSLLGTSSSFRVRPHPSSIIANQGSNKRLRKPD